MCYDNGGRMYTFKDKVVDAVACVVWAGIFLALWCAGAIADLTIIGM